MSTPTDFGRTASFQHAQQSSPVEWIAAGLTPYSIPVVNYEPSRWATARTKNVEEIAKSWTDNPSLAYVFNDSKLRGDELVLLRKELVDKIVTPLVELSRGHAAICVDIDTIDASVESLKHTLNSLVSCLDPNAQTVGEAARAALATVKAIEAQVKKLSSSLVVSDPSATGIAPLDEDERAFAKELLAEEESD